MKTKYIYITFLISLMLLFACKNNTKTIVKESYKNGNPKLKVTYSIKDSIKIKLSEVGLYKNENILFMGFYDKSGQRDGKWQYFHENGHLWSLGYYKNGKRQGLSIVYYKNGQKRIQGKYHNGEKIGIWKFWSKKGKLIKSIPFNNKK